VTTVKSSTVLGAQAAKLPGSKVEVRQASTCKSHERKWRRLVLAVLNVLEDVSQWRAYYVQIKSNQIYFSVAEKNNTQYKSLHIKI